MNREELKKNFEQRFTDTAKIRGYFKASELQKILHYPPQITFFKFLSKISPSVNKKTIVSQKLFSGRDFLTEGYYLDYFTCGYISEDNEVRMTRYLFNHLPDSGTFFDVGTHYGFYSLLVKDISPKITIHCFEPSPSTFKILSENIKGTDILLNQFALSSALGENKFAIFKDHGLAGSNSLYVEEAKQIVHTDAYDQIVVQTKTLDSYCAQPSILKIDVEGAEEDVIAGGLKMISQYHPEIIMELWPVGHNDRHMKAFTSLENLGYEFFRITDSGELSSIDLSQMQNLPEIDNIVCRHSSIK